MPRSTCRQSLELGQGLPARSREHQADDGAVLIIGDMDSDSHRDQGRRSDQSFEIVIGGGRCRGAQADPRDQSEGDRLAARSPGVRDGWQLLFVFTAIPMASSIRKRARHMSAISDSTCWRSRAPISIFARRSGAASQQGGDNEEALGNNLRLQIESATPAPTTRSRASRTCRSTARRRDRHLDQGRIPVRQLSAPARARVSIPATFIPTCPMPTAMTAW
jgi:hypothetical protein